MVVSLVNILINLITASVDAGCSGMFDDELVLQECLFVLFLAR